MKLFARCGLSLFVSAASVLSGTVPAEACFFPFMPAGWGGYGYGAPAPNYGGYYAGYRPMWAAPVPVGFYSAAYAPVAYGCAPVCCDPCASGCATGDCATNSCVGTSTDSLKPAADPAFRSKNNDVEKAPTDSETFGADPKDDRSRYERERDPMDGFSTPNPAATPGGDQWDATGRPKAPASDPLKNETAPAGSKTTAPGFDPVPDDGLFSEDPLERKSNRPPITDPAPEAGGTGTGGAPAGDAPADVTEPKKELPDFLSPVPNPGVNLRGPQTANPVADATSDKAVGSQLREVIPRTRLAGRSLSRPALHYSATEPARPIRWISVPKAESQVRL